MKKLGSLLALGACLLSAEGLNQHDRDFAMSHLQASRKLFLDSITGLTPAQWSFKPGPDRWSISETADHILITEGFLYTTVTTQIMKTPPQTPDPEREKVAEERVLKMVPDRTTKVKAPEPIQPKGDIPDAATISRDFKEKRDRLIAYVQSSDDDMRAHMFTHPFLGPLDAYGWILSISAHTERHVAQINEVKADPNYPK